VIASATGIGPRDLRPKARSDPQHPRRSSDGPENPERVVENARVTVDLCGRDDLST
jgi:hypothetical protein